MKNKKIELNNVKMLGALFLLTIGFSLQTFTQVPSGYTVVKTHYDDITWYEVRSDDGSLGSVYNNKVIKECSCYYSVSYTHGYFFFEYESGDYFVYDKNGNEVDFGVANIIDDYKIVNGRLYMIKRYQGIFDEKLNKIAYCGPFYGPDYENIPSRPLYYFNKTKNGCYWIEDIDFKYGLIDLSNGNRVLETIYGRIEIKENGTEDCLIVTSGKKGIYSSTGEEILAVEFEDCDCLDNDLFKFKLNGYWGVLNRQGNVVIPLSRQYTKIDYSRTLKTFTFEKEDGRKGECNAKGVQTSITKAQAQKPESKSSKTSSSALTGSNKGNYKMGDKYYNIEFHGEYLLVESKRFEFESLKEGCFYYSSEELNLWLVYCDINEIKVYNNEAFLAYQLYGKDIHAILKRVE